MMNARAQRPPFELCGPGCRDEVADLKKEALRGMDAAGLAQGLFL